MEYRNDIDREWRGGAAVFNDARNIDGVIVIQSGCKGVVVAILSFHIATGLNVHFHKLSHETLQFPQFCSHRMY